MNDGISDSAVVRLSIVNEKIQKAVDKAGRNDKVCLVAVSKTHGVDVIKPVLDAGQRVFGENRVQEAQSKWPHLKEQYNHTRLHLIGPLQTNKAGDAVQLFDCIETVDREKLARVLAKEGDRAGRLPDLFVQVNTGCEPQKAGVHPSLADEFIGLCRKTYGLEISGLMCIPPVSQEPSLHFALLAKIAVRNGIKNLSMGMSADFETAIALGATHVRVGSAIFGNREY